MSRMKSQNKNPSPVLDENVENGSEKIQGVRLRVYMLLAKSPDQEFGLRQIARELSLSSVSLATYHLDKLLESNLVKKTENNKYRVGNIIPIDPMEKYLTIGGKMVYKDFFYLAFSTSSLVGALIFGFLFQFDEIAIILLFSNAIVGVTVAWKRYLKFHQHRKEMRI